MAWRIDLTATAVKQLGKLDKAEAKRITAFLRQRLATLDDPRSTGKALTGPQLARTGATGSGITGSSVTFRMVRSASW